MESLYRGCLQVRVNALQGFLTHYIAFNQFYLEYWTEYSASQSAAQHAEAVLDGIGELEALKEQLLQGVVWWSLMMKLRKCSWVLVRTVPSQACVRNVNIHLSLLKLKVTKNLSNKDKGDYFFGEQDGGINPLHPNIRMHILHTGRICAIF